MLEIRDLSKRFSGLTAVSNVTFAVPEGEITALIGPNGAGKTTCFNMIAGALEPTSGSIHLAGEDITGLKAEHVAARGLSRTFQVVRPMHGMSVRDNAMVGALARGASMAEAAERALDALAMVGLGDKADVEAANLTLPDRKMLEIARCLAMRPRILLLDEAMAGLRPTEADRVVHTLRKLNADGLTILLIEHVMRVVMAIARRVVVLHHGERIAEGTPAQIAADETVIASYLGTKRAGGAGA